MKTAYISVIVFVLTASVVRGQSALEQQFPENPQPIRPMLHGGYEIDRAKLVHEPRALTKKFVFAHSLYLASTVFDIETTHQGIAHHKCVEGGEGIADPHPARGEMYAKDMTVFAVLTGLDFVFAKLQPPKAFRWMPYMGSTVGTIQHLRGGTQWYARCW
jgi:hypothetical protein